MFPSSVTEQRFFDLFFVFLHPCEVTQQTLQGSHCRVQVEDRTCRQGFYRPQDTPTTSTVARFQRFAF